jgi:putative transposase
MPRTARVAPRDYVYHVLTRGNNRQNIFKDEEDYTKYIEILNKYRERYQYKLYHYVLMTNHVHLVMETTAGGELSQIMKGINLSYAQHYKKRYKYTGHFWQDRFKSILISKDEYLLSCGSYVELNPVRAGMVKDPKEYRWSSYRANAYGQHNELLDDHVIYGKLFQDREIRQEYRKFVHQMMEKKESMKGEMDRRTIYGGGEFVREVNKRFKIDARIKERGRPRINKDEEGRKNENKLS